MSDDIMFEDVPMAELEVAGRLGRTAPTDLYPLLLHIAGMPAQTAVKVTNFPENTAQRLRSAVWRRWPHLQVRKVGDVLIVQPRNTVGGMLIIIWLGVTMIFA